MKLTRSGFLMMMIFTQSLLGHALSQDNRAYGYIQIPDTSKWLLGLNDSLIHPHGQLIVPVIPGNYRLVLYPINAKNWQVVAIREEIEIVPGDTLFPEISEIPLNKTMLQSFAIQSQQRTPDLDMFGNRKSRSNSYLRPALLFTAVSANWTAFYLKRQADDYYSEYTKTSNLSRIKHNYDQASRFDIYSTVMLGVSAGAMLTYMYLLLTD